MKGKNLIRMRCGLLALALGLPAFVSALGAEPKRVTGPQPAAHWRVEYQYGGDKGTQGDETASSPTKSADRLRTVEYQVFKNIAEIKTVYGDGREQTEYLFKEYRYYHDWRSGKPAIESILGSDSRRLYPEFSIPLKEFYAGTVEAFGQKCFYYRSDHGTPKTPEEEPGELWEGWVSCESGRPVAFRTGNRTGKFVFLPPPAGPIALPQVFVDLAAATFKPPPPPGSVAGKRR